MNFLRNLVLITGLMTIFSGVTFIIFTIAQFNIYFAVLGFLSVAAGLITWMEQNES